jgi:glycosyltransferase involved in cell wall biosynthesis
MNLQQPDISIIIPVYNVERHLVKCLDSIFSQEFSGTFEVIALEAFSTDNSLALLKSYLETDPRLKIIEHSFKEKLSTSRVIGINASSGDYIMHVDSDDWLLPNALETLLKVCKETDADIVVFDYITENFRGKRSSVRHITKKLFTTDKLKVQSLFYGACWNKIVKRGINENLIYGEIGATTTEDLAYSIEILLKAEKICQIPEPFYVYFVNTDSSSFLTSWDQYLKNQIIIINQLQQIFVKYHAKSIFIENTLDYFEKWIYLQLARIHFWQREKLESSSKLVEELFGFQIMTEKRINRLKLSLRSRFLCLIEVTKRFGLKMCLGIIRRSFWKTEI